VNHSGIFVALLTLFSSGCEGSYAYDDGAIDAGIATSDVVAAEITGFYVQDWEYTGAGDLDRCNGMTVAGHYVTESYPWIMGCFSGTLHSSFSKN
jgi:hypothetical protein